MKININGVTREMSQEEEAAYLAGMERLAAEMPKPEPDPKEKRMDEIEMALMELAAMLAGGNV